MRPNIIYNTLIPFPGYKAMAIWPFVFVRSKYEDGGMADKDIRHESIHLKQQGEMLVIPFIIWYLAEWFVRLFKKGNAYRNISFEREAYANEGDETYLQHRKHYAWIHYLRNSEMSKKSINHE